MMKHEDPIILPCPKCGDTEQLFALDKIEGMAGIQGFERDKDGALEPEYTGDTDMLWDTQRPLYEEAPYYCRGCSSHLAITDGALVVVHEPDVDNPLERFIAAARGLRMCVDVSRINNSKKSTARWEAACEAFDKAIAEVK